MGSLKTSSVGPASTMCPGWPSPSTRNSAQLSETRLRLLHVVGDDHDGDVVD